jgi:hypothetical protein
MHRYTDIYVVSQRYVLADRDEYVQIDRDKGPDGQRGKEIDRETYRQTKNNTDRRGLFR